jgi:TM2 domain-containing membrane protein YozV
MAPSSAPAGWYRQPDGTERYWTGAQWSPHVRPAPVPPPAVASGVVVPATPQPAQQVAPMMQGQYGYVPARQVAPKNPALAVIASFFVPGLGQFVNGQGGKGVAFLLSYIGSLVLILVFVGVFLAPIVWIWSMIDAYSGAQRWNARYGILS